MQQEGLRRVQFSTLVRAPREKVYDALATSEGLDAWFTTGATVDARPGGRIDFRWRGWGPNRYTGELGGAVLEARRPERFVFHWPSDSGATETTIAVDFEARDDGTMVRVEEHGFEDSARGLQDLLNRASGWGCALTLLKFHVEHGVTY